MSRAADTGYLNCHTGETNHHPKAGSSLPHLVMTCDSISGFKTTADIVAGTAVIADIVHLARSPRKPRTRAAWQKVFDQRHVTDADDEVGQSLSPWTYDATAWTNPGSVVYLDPDLDQYVLLELTTHTSRATS